MSTREGRRGGDVSARETLGAPRASRARGSVKAFSGRLSGEKRRARDARGFFCTTACRVVEQIANDERSARIGEMSRRTIRCAILVDRRAKGFAPLETPLDGSASRTSSSDPGNLVSLEKICAEADLARGESLLPESRVPEHSTRSRPPNTDAARTQRQVPPPDRRCSLSSSLPSPRRASPPPPPPPLPAARASPRARRRPIPPSHPRRASPRLATP